MLDHDSFVASFPFSIFWKDVKAETLQRLVKAYSANAFRLLFEKLPPPGFGTCWPSAL
jgi:hypothetical protein